MGRWVRIFGLLLAIGAVGVSLALYDAWDATGAVATGARWERMTRSPQWRGDHFVDTIPRVEPAIVESTRRWIQGTANSTPNAPIAVVTPPPGFFETPPASGLRLTWFGHSTVLVEIDGQRVLFDPIWGDRCSPFSFAGPKRFFPPPLPLEQLPKVDVVVISHDHYDHLDHPTIVALAKRQTLFLVPLGVGAHLEYWGVPPAQIVEKEWWEETAIGALKVVTTPARHFSGRSLRMADRDRTLWAGWALIGPQHRVFYSGDTAMFPGFAEIGARLGPFDAALIEVGAYDQLWADVHLGPEQAVQANLQLQANLLFPVHWGTFDLALHPWTEPIERLLVAAAQAGVRVASPRPGESVEPAAPPALAKWWPEVPWRTAAVAPVVSSGLSAAKPSE